MAADASVEFDVNIDESRFDDGIHNLNKGMERFRGSLERSAKAAGDAFGGKTQQNVERLTNQYERQVEAIERQRMTVEKLQEEYTKLVTGEADPKALIAMGKQLDRNIAESDKLKQSIGELEGKLEKSGASMGLATPEIVKMQNELAIAKARYDELIDSGNKLASEMDRMKFDPAATEQAQMLSQQLEIARNKLSRLNNEASATQGKIKAAFDEQPIKRVNNEIRRTPRHVNDASNAIDRFAKRIKSLLIAAFVFNIIRKGITGLKKYLNGLLSTNAEFVKSTNQIKAGLATAFQPIYEAVLPALNAFMSAMAKAIAYVATFINALFGKTVKESQASAAALNQQAEELKGVGKAAKSAAGGLAKFDDINQQAQDTAAGGAAGAGVDMSEIIMTDLPEVDISPLMRFIDFLKSRFEPEIMAFKDMMDREGALWGAAFAKVAEDIKPMMASFATYMQTDFLNLIGNSIKNATTLVGRFSEIFRGFFTLGWETMKPYLDTFFSNTLSAVTQNYMKIQDSMTNILMSLSGPLEAVGRTVINVLGPIIGWFMTSGLELFTKFAADIADIFDTIFAVASKIFMAIWSDAIDPAMQLVKKVTLDTLEIVKNWWMTYGDGIKNSVKSVFTAIGDMFFSLWNGILKPVIDKMIAAITPLWDNHIKPVLEKLGELVAGIAQWIGWLFNTVLKPVFDWLVDMFGPIIVDVFSWVFKVLGDIFGSIMDILGGVIDFLTGVFTGNWEKMWQGLVNIGKGLLNLLIGIVEGAINAVIWLINGLISGINNITGAIGIPAIPSIPELKIPRLAQGGLIPANQPQLVVVGDNKTQDEIVSPVDKMREVFADVLSEFMAATQKPTQVTVIMEADKRNLGKVTFELGNEHVQRMGMRIQPQGAFA